MKQTKLNLVMYLDDFSLKDGSGILLLSGT